MNQNLKFSLIGLVVGIILTVIFFKITSDHSISKAQTEIIKTQEANKWLDSLQKIDVANAKADSVKEYAYKDTILFLKAEKNRSDFNNEMLISKVQSLSLTNSILLANKTINSDFNGNTIVKTDSSGRASIDSGFIQDFNILNVEYSGCKDDLSYTTKLFNASQKSLEECDSAKSKIFSALDKSNMIIKNDSVIYKDENKIIKGQKNKTTVAVIWGYFKVAAVAILVYELCHNHIIK